VGLSESSPPSNGAGSETFQNRFLTACRREAVDRTPVWFMRQAGRHLPEYRALRGDKDVLTMCRTPELAAEIAMLPVRRYEVDAAILFCDIMVPLAAIGLDVRIVKNRGPAVEEPFRSAADLARLRPLEPELDVPYVLETVRLLRKELRIPLIGFAGAPFTMASYLIEGGPTRDHILTKSLMHNEPEVWNRLMSVLGDLVLTFLRSQVEAGAQAVQLFDSWAGALSPDDYEQSVLPTSRRILEGLADLEVPRIHFGVGTGELLPLMRAAGADVVGVDWRTPIDLAWERIGLDSGVQGNLDPAACLGPWETVQRKAVDVLARVGGRPGHVFNLGHGVLPQTSPDTLARLVDLVHERTESVEAE
jgi:uroporphyrinogen decarboxylase